MNTTVELGGVLTRPKVVHLTNISKKSEERQRNITIPADIVVRKPRAKKKPEALPPGSYALPSEAGQATVRGHHTFDKPPYATGDGDITYALRPGALDFKKYASFGNRT